MGKKYYYFAASLPLIFFDSPQTIALEDYLMDCQRLLTSADFQELRAVVVGDGMQDVKNNIAVMIQGFERDCCNEKAFLRATRAKQNPMDHCRGERSCDPQIVDVMHRAVKEDDLLTGEKLIDQYRFNILDALSGAHDYDLEFLMIYGLKLKILERYKSLQSQAGQETFEQIKNMELPEVVVL